MATLSRFAPQLASSASLAAKGAAAAAAGSALMPRGSLIGAVQSYANVHGHAITVRFNESSNIEENATSSSFLSNPLAVGSFESAVLEEWFNKLSQPRFRINKGSYGVPLEDVEKRIGLINTAYHTAYVGSNNSAVTSSRPFAGSAEFSLLPHRQELNFQVTLWDSQRRPLSTTTWTGPKGNSGGGPMGMQLSSDQVEREEKKMQRVALPPPTEQGTSSLVASWSVDGAVASSIPFVFDSASFRSTKNGGFSVQVLPKETKSAGNDDDDDDEAPALLPSSLHDFCVALFATNVWSRVMLHLKLEEDTAALAHSLPFCAVVAKTATLGAVRLDQPFELRSSPPLFCNKLLSKPWEHVIGLPLLRGQKCLALRIETIQKGTVAGVGTYYFSKF